jgi:hypothetical protein
MSFQLYDSLTLEILEENYTKFLSPKGNLINLKYSLEFGIDDGKNSLWRYRKSLRWAC